MDLGFAMSSLFITTKRRRVSGLLGCAPLSPAPEDHQSATEDNPDCKAPVSPASSSPPSTPHSESPEMGKTDPSIETRRSGRRKSVINIDPCTSAAVSSLQEFNVDDAKDIKQLRKIYLDKRVRKTAPTLETIFESPTDEKIMSARKFKRAISFQNLQNQKNRVKKRPLKAKQCMTNYNKLRRKNKVSMEALLQKLGNLESDGHD